MWDFLSYSNYVEGRSVPWVRKLMLVHQSYCFLFYAVQDVSLVISELIIQFLKHVDSQITQAAGSSRDSQIIFFLDEALCIQLLQILTMPSFMLESGRGEKEAERIIPSVPDSQMHPVRSQSQACALSHGVRNNPNKPLTQCNICS